MTKLEKLDDVFFRWRIGRRLYTDLGVVMAAGEYGYVGTEPEHAAMQLELVRWSVWKSAPVKRSFFAKLRRLLCHKKYASL